MKKDKKLIVLVMSVGPCEKNGTVKWLKKIHAPADGAVVCLPNEKSEYAGGYEKAGWKVYVYNEKKHIGPGFEFFGFRPRNCGGVGRQGIAEAVEKFGNENAILLELDDDTSSYQIRSRHLGAGVKNYAISEYRHLSEIMNVLDRLYDATGVEMMGTTGAIVPQKECEIIANHRIFNNFIMRKGERLNFFGFAALCSDDYRFNVYRNLVATTPMVALDMLAIIFTQSQGCRADGNAPLYNKDCSWKKSYALKMMVPWCAEQHIANEKGRLLFRENLTPRKLFPPICLEEDGEVIGESRW